MATLPKRVQDQLDAADAILAQANKPQEPAAPVESAAPEPQQAPSPEPTPAPVAPPPQQSQDVNWEHKFRTLQGLFNAEVPKLQQQVKDLTGRYQEAIVQLEKRATQPTEPEKKAPVADPKDVENFGSDLVDMVQRVTQAVTATVAQRMDTMASTFEQRLSGLERAIQGTNKTVELTAEQLFFQELSAAVPNWKEINADQRFLDWLAEVDPVYGQPRQVALDAAQQSLNPTRASNVFKAFAKTIATPAAPKVDPLSKQVSPSAAASAPPQPTEKQILTQQQVSAFYADVAKGKYRGREAEVERLNAIVNEALADGRVR